MKLSIIVPVFNEESTISHVLESLTRVQFPCAVETIVVDDGSTDRTAANLALMNRDNIFKVHTS
ncbi:MAG TPA: glycosyltransferase, partial [Candidatus Krumholzibacteriaceae bacterium]